MKRHLLAPLVGAALATASAATPENLAAAYTGKAYSPYAERSFPERPLWGDTHLHTSLSVDAGLFGNTLPPEVPMTLQERAYTSPIWYTPRG